MSEVQEKDNFWLYIILAVVFFAGAILMVKNSEHDKYVSASKAIAEDAVMSKCKASPKSFNGFHCDEARCSQ